MKRILLLILILTLFPYVRATDVAVGIESGVKVYPQQTPYVWMCGERQVFDDDIQPGRISGRREILT